jgi:hypothetical protein
VPRILTQFLYNKLITACQDLEPCKYACYKPADTLAGLINDLWSSITTYKASNPPANTQAFVTDPQTDLDAYFTDRRYRQQYPQRPNPTRNFRGNFRSYTPRGRQPDEKKKKKKKYGRSPGRFKFTLREDLDFNHSVYVDIMYINGSPVLHIIDEATRYQAPWHWQSLWEIEASYTGLQRPG